MEDKKALDILYEDAKSGIALCGEAKEEELEFAFELLRKRLDDLELYKKTLLYISFSYGLKAGKEEMCDMSKCVVDCKQCVMDYFINETKKELENGNS